MARHMCRTCGRELDDNIKFCPNCGAPQEGQALHICEDCGKEVPAGNDICPNCGRPVKSSKSETTKRMPVERQKAPSTGKVILTVLGLTFLTVLVIAAGLFGISKLHDIKQHKEKLAQAEVLMNSGEYVQALQIYESLVADPATEEHANRCRYRFGKSLMESGNWDQAKVQLQSISVEDYEDSAALIEQCDSEIARIEKERRQAEEAERKRKEDAERKANSADDAFLSDLQSIIIGRLQTNMMIPDSSIAITDYNRLAKYRNQQFYDKDLGDTAKAFIRVLGYQKDDAQNSDYNLPSKQEIWCGHNATLAGILYTMYNDYGFMKNNDAFLREFVSDRSKQERIADALHAVNTHISDSFEENNSWQYFNDFQSFMTLHNKSRYTITVQFKYDVYTQDKSTFLYSDTYTAENIPPRTDYNIYLNESYASTYYGITTVFAEWEVINMQK